ncbi:perlucin-like protein isoform X2 [Macrobrachium rosenbergii]|uniref:perlucin-like protein isoform X2 n=1 Tax=Macrobrachium rosenbergii TaxID=79674 RepID=UPI0034D6BDA5
MEETPIKGIIRENSHYSIETGPFKINCYIFEYQHAILIVNTLEIPGHDLIAQAVASDKVASGLKTIISLMATDHLVCEGGWVKLRSSCYFMSKDTSNWEESRQKCINMNSDLVKITHDEEYNFLRNLAKGHNTYVGLSDRQEEGTYRWVVDGTIHKLVESWWAEGEPNNSAERCVHYYLSKDDRFNDVNCGDVFRYICEKPAQLDWNFAAVPDEETSADK